MLHAAADVPGLWTKEDVKNELATVDLGICEWTYINWAERTLTMARIQ